MAVFEKTFVQDLTQDLTTRHCEAIAFSADNDSNVVSVEIYNGGEPATVTGSVVVYAIRADSNTVIFTGTLTGNVVSATLPQSCFVAPGPLAVMLQIISGDVKTTVLKAVFTVEASSTGALIDPGSVVPDISDLLAMLDDMATATAAANAAAAAVPDLIAPTFSTSDSYAVGDYVYYDGDLYRFTSAHSAGAWSSADVESITVGEVLESLDGDTSLLMDKALIVVDSDKTYYHNVTPQKVTVYPNAYTQTIPVRYAGSKNLFEGQVKNSGTVNGITLTADGRFVKLSGSGTSGGLNILESTDSAFINDLKGKTVNICIYIHKQTDWGNTSAFRVRVNDSTNLKSQYFSPTSGSYAGKMLGWTMFANISFPAELTKVRIYFDSLDGSSFTSGDYLWMAAYTATPVITETTLTTDPAEISVSGLTYIDTMMHESVVEYIADTKTYVDEHTPDIIGYWTDNVYALPEDFGAKGDGVTDDATALANCIAYAVSSGKAIRGYGKYKTSAAIALGAQNMDVYLREIDYTGNGSAVEIRHENIKFEFHKITSAANGLTYMKNASTDYWARRCTVSGNAIVSTGVCVTAQRKTCYNTCDVRYLESVSGNCIVFSLDGDANDFEAREYVFRSSTCKCTNGYVGVNMHGCKVYDFTIEKNCRYGFLNPISCTCIGIRHREQVDGMYGRIINGESDNNGPLITFTVNPNLDGNRGFKYITADALPWYSIDVSAVQGYASTSDGEEWLTLAYSGIDLGVSIRGLHNTSRDVIGEKMFFIGCNKVYVPPYRSTYVLNKAEYDMTLFEDETDQGIYDANEQGGWGTDFVTGYSHTDYYMNASFGAVGYNDLTFKQVDGKTVTVYDKLGNAIFDGTNAGDGTWRLQCTVDTTSRGRKEGSSSLSWWCYDGTNETWTVTKLS